MNRRKFLLALLGGGAAATAVGAWWSAFSTVSAIKKGVGSAPAYDDGAGGTFKVHPTGYWPYTAREDEKKMEGKPVDRKGAKLYTLEDFLSGKSDHVSGAGDYEIFPYGQKLIVDGWPDVPNLVIRVTDTGGHFHGSKKIYRVMGEEPIDFCVYTRKTFVPKKGITARIVPGDHWAKKGLKDVDKSKIRDQVVGAEICVYCLDGYHHLCDCEDKMGRCSCDHNARSDGLIGLDLLAAA